MIVKYKRSNSYKSIAQHFDFSLSNNGSEYWSCCLKCCKNVGKFKDIRISLKCYTNKKQT